MSAKIQRPKLLIVEGRDEEQFLTAALADHLGLTDIQVMPIGGKSKLTQSLSALVLDPGYASVVSLAVLRDADTPFGDVPAADVGMTEANRAFQSICGSLRHVGLPCPPGHGQFVNGPPRIGMFIVPNGVGDGMLETLCLQSVSALPEFPCVDGLFQCLQGYGPLPTNLHKARAHAWLASHPRPGLRVGEAAQAGYWPWDSDAFTDLWSFIILL